MPLLPECFWLLVIPVLIANYLNNYSGGLMPSISTNRNYRNDYNRYENDNEIFGKSFTASDIPNRRNNASLWIGAGIVLALIVAFSAFGYYHKLSREISYYPPATTSYSSAPAASTSSAPNNGAVTPDANDAGNNTAAGSTTTDNTSAGSYINNNTAASATSN
jgi:hypothetical protein